MWNLPGPGTEPGSATLAGRCITTELLGKPNILVLLKLLRLDLCATISPVLVNILHALGKTLYSALVQRTVLQASIPGGFPGGSVGKESACSVGDTGVIPGSGRSPGEGNSNPL